MCGRVVQASDPLRYSFVDGLSLPDNRTKPPSYNAALSQLLYVIRQNHETGEHTLELLRWGLIPHGCKDPDGGRKPIHARAGTVAQLPTFRRSIVFLSGGRAIKGARAEQPFVVAMKDRAPFAIARLWDNWRHPESGDWSRTFVILTVPANDRMPAILEPAGYDRWLALEPDPYDLLITYPSEPMTMWPISRRVNKRGNDDASLDRIADPFDDAWAPLRSEGKA